MKYLIIIFLIIGCKAEEYKPDPLHEKAISVTCTKEQLDLASKDFEICHQSSYFSSHCYDIAKVSYCK